MREYLVQYQQIFTTNPNAKKLKTLYVDAFAGTGDRDANEDIRQSQLFGYDEDIRYYQEGSVRVALSLDNKFHQYIFIDNKVKHASALNELIEQDFSDLTSRCSVERENANHWLPKWCRTQDWRGQRAVVFLDPYGMNVEWETIKAIAETKAIDLWILFPLGIGASRILPNEAAPEGLWAERLTRLFGTDEWRTRFYRQGTNLTLFGDEDDSVTKIAGVNDILEFFLERLKSIFQKVVDRPLILENSKRSPMYALCFAAGNPKGAATAVRIAGYLAGRKSR